MPSLGHDTAKGMKCRFIGLRRAAQCGGALLLMAPQLAGAASGFPVFKNIEELVQKGLCPVGLYMFAILIVLSVIFVLYAAYLYLTSGGDAEKVTKATKTLTFTAVAIVVALVARAFPFIVGSFFGANLGSSVCQ